MAYQLHYWESTGKDSHAELRVVRLKSIEEVFPLSLPHNRPTGTTLITLDRSDNQSNIEVTVWDCSWEPHVIHDVRRKKKSRR